MAKGENQVNPWEELKGKKEELESEVEVKMGDTKVNIPITFVDVDRVQEINEEYDEKMPEKPVVPIETNRGKMNMKLPTDDEKYQQFNNHPKAEEWRKKAKPIQKQRDARLAYEFIEEDSKPSNDPEEGVEIIMDRLRRMDIVDIINEGFELNGMRERLDEAEKNS